MPTKIEDWLDHAVARYDGVSLTSMSHEKFFRDPPRAQYVDRNYFWSPADGVILYQKQVDPDDDLVEAKGVDVCLRDMMGHCCPDCSCLVVGVFMSFYDVHVNRMPSAGILSHHSLPPLRTTNVPMLWVEHGIVQEGQVRKGNMKYLKPNARAVNTIYDPWLRYTYYMVQLADSDVSVIMHFKDVPYARYSQGERFSVVRWGSQVDLILPLDERYRFKTICRPTDHVEAGLDALVKIERC